MHAFLFFFFFFNDTATTEIYTLSLHDALPISTTGASFMDKATILISSSKSSDASKASLGSMFCRHRVIQPKVRSTTQRSEEHTSELQSRLHLVCRLLLEKKKKQKITTVNVACR